MSGQPARGLTNQCTKWLQDPFFRLAMIPNRATAKTVIKSRVSWLGGNNPTFDASVWYELKVSAGLSEEEIEATVVHVEVWDKDLFSENDLIGEAEIPLGYIFNQRKVAKWVIMKRGADVWKSNLIKEPHHETLNSASQEGNFATDAGSLYRPTQTLTGFVAKAPFTTQQGVHSAIAQNEKDSVTKLSTSTGKVQSAKERLEGYQENRIYVFVLTALAMLMFMYAFFNNWKDFADSGKHPLSKGTQTALYTLEVVAFVGWLLDLLIRFYVQGGSAHFFCRWLNAFDMFTLIVDMMLILQRSPAPLFSNTFAHRLSLVRGARLLRLLALFGELTVLRDGDTDVWTLVELLVVLESNVNNEQRIMITWTRMGREYGPVRMVGCGVGDGGARILAQSEMDPALGLNTRESGCIFQLHFEASSDGHKPKFGELLFDAQSATVANRWVKEIQKMSESVQSRSKTWTDEQHYLETTRSARTRDVGGIRKLNLDETRTYVWESTGSGVAGIEAVGKDIGGGAIGVQVRDLEEVLHGFTGEVWALPLRSAHDQMTQPHTRLLEALKEDQLKYMQTLVTKVHEAFFKRSYQMNCLKQCSVIAPSLTSLANCCCPCASCNESVFCSEFAVDVYQALGIMGVDIDPEKVIPCDFLGGYDGFPKFGRPIPLRLHQERMRHAGDEDAFTMFYGQSHDALASEKLPEFHVRGAHRLSEAHHKPRSVHTEERLEFSTILPDGES